MKIYRKSRFQNVCVALGLATLSCTNQSVQACATLTEDLSPVRVADESALIIWDSTTKTEHFIRRATFDTQAKNIGFLVPTPGLPKLGEAEDEIFDQLQEKLRPRVVHQTVRQYEPTSLLLSLVFARRVQTVFNNAQNALSTSTTGGVEVISEQRVGEYNTAILRANDVNALQRWLKKNGYVSGPAFDEWLQPYVKKGWFITAFKYVKTSGNAQIESDAIRMSFKSDKPFFPYREPQRQGSAKQNQQPHPRLLRVFMIAEGRMDGQLEDGETSSNWQHKVPFAKHFEYDDKMQLNWSAPKTAELIQPGWLTVFEDRASVRSSRGDLFWQLSKQQTPVEPPPIIKERIIPIYIPIEPFLLMLVGIYMLWKRRAE